MFLIAPSFPHPKKIRKNQLHDEVESHLCNGRINVSAVPYEHDQLVFHFFYFMFHEFGWRKAYFYNRISNLEFCFVFRYAASGYTLHTRRRFLVYVRHGTNQTNKQINTQFCGSLNKSCRRLCGLGETNFESTSQCDGINYIDGNGAETETEFCVLTARIAHWLIPNIVII